MPELPEVETVVRDLRKKVRGRTIISVWFDWPKMIKDYASQSRVHVSQSAVKRFPKDIIGERILEIHRRGKNILLYLTHGKVLLIHQKMTGHILVGKWNIAGATVTPVSPKAVVTDPYNGFIHLILTLDDGRMIALSDVRKFAKVILGTQEQIESLPELTLLGPDALDPKLSLARFSALIRANKRMIKKVLLDPFVIAGIGNIYSDDMLWRARIHPEVSAAKLTDAQLRRLLGAMRTVLATAVRLRGTSTSDFRDTAGNEGGYTNYRYVYQRTGSPCQRCKTPIKRIVVGGRGTHFCPRCQAGA